MAATYKVIFTGKLKPNVTAEQVLEQLVSYFGLSTQQAGALLKATPPVIVKKGITLEQGKSLGIRLSKIGLEVKLLKQGTGPIKNKTVPPPAEAEKSTMPPPAVPPSSEQEIAVPVEEKAEYKALGKAGFRNFFSHFLEVFATAKEVVKTQIEAISSDKTTADTATSEKAAEPSIAEAPAGSAPGTQFFVPPENVKTLTYGEKTERGTPEKVSVGQGYRWLIYAFDMLKEYPLQWIVLVTGLFCILALAHWITFGLSSLLFPVFVAGLMLGAHQQEAGKEFRFDHFIDGFTSNRNQLFLLGAIAAIGTLICSLPLIGSALGADMLNSGAGAESKGILTVILNITGVVFSGALSFAFSMAMWFAPLLVAVEKQNAVPAMKVSFKATLKNILPFTVFAVSSIAVFSLLSLAATFMIPLIIADGFHIASIFMVLPVVIEILLVLPILSLVVIAMYTSYRDIFYQ